MAKSLISLTAAFLLAACGGRADASSSMVSDPVVSDFEIREDGRIYIDAQLSGIATDALVDTGLSSRFLMPPATAATVRPRYVPFLRTAVFRGIDGEGSRGRMAAVKITNLGGVAGDWDILSVVIDLATLRADAVLGMGFLRDYDLVIDFKSSKMTLSDPGQVTVPATAFQNCDPTKPSFSLEGPCGASSIYLDTGGQTTIMNSAMAHRLGLPTDARGEQANIRGANGRVLEAYRHEVPLHFGDITLSSYRIADFPNRGGCTDPCAELILGMDFLGTLSSLVITRESLALIP